MSPFRKVLIAANWKMYKTEAESLEFLSDFVPQVDEPINNVEIVICPPFTALSVVNCELQGSELKLGAQDVFWAEEGAFTGEVSPRMLLDLNCHYVIIGHSERRQIMGETDIVINRKLQAASAAGLIPIFCVGETLPQRQANLARQIVGQQLQEGLKGFPRQELVVAYEPVWAIGTGINASAEDAQEMAHYIREELSRLYDENWAEEICILYGGSVKPDNIAQFITLPDIDGALVGGASLSASDFARIVRLDNNA